MLARPTPFPAVSTHYSPAAAMRIPSARARMPSLPPVLNTSDPFFENYHRELMHHIYAITDQNTKNRRFSDELVRVCQKSRRTDLWNKMLQLDTSFRNTVPGAMASNGGDKTIIAGYYKRLYALMETWTQVNLELVTLSVEVAIDDYNDLSRKVQSFNASSGDANGFIREVRQGCRNILRTICCDDTPSGQSTSRMSPEALAVNMMLETLALMKGAKPGYRQYFSTGCRTPSVRR